MIIVQGIRSGEIYGQYLLNIVDWDNVVGVDTYCGLGSLGIKSRWGARFSLLVQTGPGIHPAPCTVGTGSLSRV